MKETLYFGSWLFCEEKTIGNSQVTQACSGLSQKFRMEFSAKNLLTILIKNYFLDVWPARESFFGVITKTLFLSDITLSETTYFLKNYKWDCNY